MQALALALPLPAAAVRSRTGADFLRMETGPRPVAMGGAFTAIADDLHAVRWNPAGLRQLQRSEIALGEKRWFADLQFHQATAARKMGPNWSAGFDLGFLDYGGIEQLDRVSRRLDHNFGARDIVLTLAAARDLVGPVCVGSSFKIIQREIERESGRTFALDLAAHAVHGRWRFGSTLQNIGRPVTLRQLSENLPLIFRAGAARRFGDRWTAAADVENSDDEGSSFRAGAEYRAGRVRWSDLVIRGGYHSLPGVRGGFSAGFGVIGFNWEFSYALKPNAPFELGHWIGIGYRFTPSRPKLSPDQYERQKALVAYEGIMKWYHEQSAAGKISRRWGTTVLERVVERYEPLGVDVSDANDELSRLQKGSKIAEPKPEETTEDPDIPSVDPLLKIPR